VIPDTLDIVKSNDKSLPQHDALRAVQSSHSPANDTSIAQNSHLHQIVHDMCVQFRPWVPS